MKTDRFVKVMLVAIALLLLANCVKEFSPSSSAAAPAFLQKGKSYVFTPAGTGISFGRQVIEVDSSGWIKVHVPNTEIDSYQWLNLNAFGEIREERQQ